MTRDLPVLSPQTRRAYLERLGVTAVEVDLAGLTSLQVAHLRALPFHNLFLLAGEGADPGLPSIEAAVEGALRGEGGTCHLLSPPFVALLRALGFDAWLAAGSVGAPGDHIVGVVRLREGLFVSDVGNGHPYLQPFPLAAGEHGQTAYGWQFAFDPCPKGQVGATHRLRRRLADGSWKTVYTLDPRPVDYASFAAIIREHHMRVGFGPFMTGLRAVRMTADVLVTLRDRQLERFHRSGRLTSRRVVADEPAIGRVLARCFGLGGAPWQAALAALRRRHPSSWALPVEVTAEPLRVVATVGVTDRAGALSRLGSGLLRARSRAGLGTDAVGLLALDNGVQAGALAAEAAALQAEGLPTIVVPADMAAEWHARLVARGLAADSPESRPRCIATCRALQAAALWQHYTVEPGLGALPRGGSPAVWMIDDDLEFSRLEVEGDGLALRPADDVLVTAASLRRAHPEVSVLIGGTTGCPPVPGFTMLAAQVVDLAAHVEQAAASSPGSRYMPTRRDRARADYHYDLSDHGPAYLKAFSWESIDDAPLDTRAALLAHLRAVPGLAWGMPCTRLLVHDPAAPLVPTTARGGNAMFFDLDALFAAPPLALRCRDGIVTRRGDTVWGELMAEQPATVVVRGPLSLHHVRRAGDHSAPLAGADGPPGAMRRFAEAQLRGTTLARLVATGRGGERVEALAVLAERTRRQRDAMACFGQLLSRLSDWTVDRTVWWRDDGEVLAAFKQALAALTDVAATTAELGGATAEPAVAAELEAFAASIPGVVARWKELWR
ncbi:arylamine N-acetyltransferase family protein [Nannocystis pusilla]|uniref:arylamine N-acetyltransferase family protein n=1 Tax=Nannocystis pusilla TaxID=889268 RepID=UPI003BF019CC